MWRLWKSCYRKVDDMTKQSIQYITHFQCGIAIVVDSGADIPAEYENEIQVVSVRYSFGNQQHIDKVTQTTKRVLSANAG